MSKRKGCFLTTIIIGIILLITISGCGAEKSLPQEKPLLIDHGPYDQNTRIVEMTTSNNTATIYYTLDGSVPKKVTASIYYPNSYVNEYGEKVNGVLVANDNVVKALVVDGPMGSYSEVATMTFDNVYKAPSYTVVGTLSETDGKEYYIVSLHSEENAEILYSVGSAFLSYSQNKKTCHTNTGSQVEGILIQVGMELSFYVKGEDKLSSSVSSVSLNSSKTSSPELLDRGVYLNDVNYKIYQFTGAEENVYKYTEDGSEPDINSLDYREHVALYKAVDGNEYYGILVANGTTLKVKAYSKMAFCSETVSVNVVVPSSPIPYIRDNGYVQNSESNKLVALSVSDGADDIYYTLDGSEPTRNSLSYSETKEKLTSESGSIVEGISVSMGTTIKAISVKFGHLDSGVSEKLITRKTATPVIEGKGVYKNDHSLMIVSMKSEDEGATIYYRTTSYASSSAYYEDTYTNIDDEEVCGVLVENGKTVNAYATCYGYYQSDNSSDFTVLCEVVAPQITDLGIYRGSKGYKRVIEITAFDGAEIHYTTDGSEPTPNSTKYKPGNYYLENNFSVTGIVVDIGKTLKAIAIKEDYANSAVSSIDVDTPVVAEVTITDRGINKADSNQRLYTIECSDRNATIYYGNGNVCYQSTRTNDSGDQIIECVALDINKTYSFYSKRDGYIDSEKKSITVKTEKAPMPTASDSGASDPQRYYDLNNRTKGTRVISASCDDPEATILYKQYSLGGTAPDYSLNYSDSEWTMMDGGTMNGVLALYNQVVEVFTRKPGYWDSDSVVIKPTAVKPEVIDYGYRSGSNTSHIIYINTNSGTLPYNWNSGTQLGWPIEFSEYEGADGKKHTGVLWSEGYTYSIVSMGDGYLNSPILRYTVGE